MSLLSNADGMARAKVILLIGRDQMGCHIVRDHLRLGLVLVVKSLAMQQQRQYELEILNRFISFMRKALNERGKLISQV